MRKKILLILTILLLFSYHAYGALITTSTSGDLIFEVIAGHGATSVQEFGLGTPAVSSAINDRNVIFTIYLVNENVNSVTPSAIVNMGYFFAGSDLDFYNLSAFGGTNWAFSSGLNSNPTPSDLVAFTDTDNSLGLGGSVVETISTGHWILHLDDAASVCCDDDDNEMIIRVRVDTTATPPAIPEPATSVLFIVGIAAFAGRHLFNRRKNM